MLPERTLCYRLGSETLAVIRGVATPVPCGSILQISANSLRLSGLVNIGLNGETVQMFAIDIQERGTLLHETQAAGQDIGHEGRAHRAAA